MADLLTVAEQHGLKDAGALIKQVAAAVNRWPKFAKDAGVPVKQQKAISKTHRLGL